MQIRFLRSWRNKKVGDVAEWPSGAADLLIRRRLAEAAESAGGEEPARGRAKRKRRA